MNEADEIAQVYNTIQLHFVGLNEVNTFLEVRDHYGAEVTWLKNSECHGKCTRLKDGLLTWYVIP